MECRLAYIVCNRSDFVAVDIARNLTQHTSAGATAVAIARQGSFTCHRTNGDCLRRPSSLVPRYNRLRLKAPCIIITLPLLYISSPVDVSSSGLEFAIMKFSPIDHLAIQLGLCSVAANGFVVHPARNANVHRHGGRMPRRGGGGATHTRSFRRHALMMTTGSENNDGLDLEAFSTPQELSDAVSDQTLQNALDTIGLKSDEGASPLDKAKLLFLTKYLPLEDIPEKYWADPKGGKEDGVSVSTDTSVAPTIAPTVDAVNATSTSVAGAESHGEENPFNSTTSRASSIDISATDMAAEHGSTDEDNGNEDATSVETTTSADALGKAGGSGNATDVDTAMPSEVDEPPSSLSETEDSTDDSASSQGNDTATDGLDLDLYGSYQELCEALDADVLRAELQRIGLKSDGTSMDMAKRLFITKYFPFDQIPAEYLEASPGAEDAEGSGVTQAESVVAGSEGESNINITENIDDYDIGGDEEEDDEVIRLEEEQRLLEMELEAVEARIGETEAESEESPTDGATEIEENMGQDEQPSKTSEVNEMAERQSQVALPTTSGNAQSAAAVKEQTERQRLEVERIKAERIAAEEEAAAIRREKERIAAAQEELEDDEQEEYEGSDIDTDGAEGIVEEDEDVDLDQGLPAALSESFEMEEDEEQPVERKKSEEISSPFNSKAPGAGLPPSSTLPSSNPFIARMPPSSTRPSSNPFADLSKEKSSEDGAPSEDQESVSDMPPSPVFSSPNPFIDPPSQEDASKENIPIVSEQAEVNAPAKEQEPRQDAFRFEADRIKAEQEAKRQELARERIEAEAQASKSKDVGTKETSSEPSIISRVASAAVGTIGLGVLAVGGSLLLDGTDSSNGIQSVPSVPSPPIVEVISSVDTSKSVPDAPIGESSRFSSEKAEDSSKSSATDSPLVDESGGTPAGDSPLTTPEAETKVEAETLQPDSDNDVATAVTSISASEEQSKDNVPVADSSSLGSAEIEAKPGAVTTDIEKENDDTSTTASALINAIEEPPTQSPPPPSSPAPPNQQQQEEIKPAEFVASKPKTISPKESDSVAVQSQTPENKYSIVESTNKVSSDNSPSTALPAFTAPSISGILSSAEKIKRIASGIDFSNGAKLAGIVSVAALGAIGAAMKSDDVENVKTEDTKSALNRTNSTTFELPKPPQATNKTSTPMPLPTKNMTAQNVILNATGIAKEFNGSSTKSPFESSTPPMPSSTGPVNVGGPSGMSGVANTGKKDQAEKNPPATPPSTPPRPQAFVASSSGPKRVAKPIDAEIISSEKDTDSDESLQKVLTEASEAVAEAEAALRNTTETTSSNNSTSSKKMDTIKFEEDKRIAAEFKAAKEKMEAEKMERIGKAKSAEAQFLDQERKEAAEKAKQKRAEAEKRIADARDTIRLEQARDQKAAVSNPVEKPTMKSPSDVAPASNGAKAFVPPATRPPTAKATPNSSQRIVSPRPSTEATPRQSGDNWFNEQLRRQQVEEKTGPSAFERSRKLADGTEIPPDPGAAYKSSSYYGTNVEAADGVLSTGEYAKSAFLAAFVGIWAAFPILGLHYLVFSDYTYTTFAQWEWELIAASVQSSCFGVLYRYALRSDVDNSSLQRIVVLAAVLLKSVIRVNVPYVCAAGDLAGGLFCADSAPFFVMNDSMTTDLFLNGLEGLAMFTAVAVSMNWLTERRRR